MKKSGLERWIDDHQLLFVSSSSFLGILIIGILIHLLKAKTLSSITMTHIAISLAGAVIAELILLFCFWCLIMDIKERKRKDQ